MRSGTPLPSVGVIVWLALTARGMAQTQPTVEESQVGGQILYQANEFRGSKNLPTVTVNRSLTAAADEFARYLARSDKFSHTADDRQPRERAAAQGYEACIVGENIGAQFSSSGFAADQLARGFIEGWKASPTHRQNLLDPDVTETGVGIAHSDRTGRYYAVQLFGRPKSQAIVLEIENRTGAAIAYDVSERKLILEPQAARTHWLCRSGAVRFWHPASTAEEEEPNATERVSGSARLVLTLSPAQQLVVTPQRAGSGER